MKNFEFNLLNIYNFNNNGKFRHMFSYVKKNFSKIEGDIIEAGVYQGNSLLSLGLFLKKIKSKKKIFAFDSFSGFKKNNISAYDNINNFKKLREKKIISHFHYNMFSKSLKIKKIFTQKVDTLNISSSGDFSNTDLLLLKKKINFLKLKNIVIRKGDFARSFNRDLPKKIFLINLDCDLYLSCKIVLESCWPRLVKGGYVWLDEYYSLKFPGPKIFIDDFAKKNHLKINTFYDPLNDFYRAYLIK
jgi:hypothetical protein